MDSLILHLGGGEVLIAAGIVEQVQAFDLILTLQKIQPRSQNVEGSGAELGAEVDRFLAITAKLCGRNGDAVK